MDAVRQTVVWRESEGFWHRHPLLAWLLMLAVAVPVYLFLAPYVLGNLDDRAFVLMVSMGVARVLRDLKKRELAKRRLKPSPFFFWF
jgi:hypothetical protein